MTIVRMWEIRLEPGDEESFWPALRQEWDGLASSAGFLGGEVFAATGDVPRAVVLSRWADEHSAQAATAFEAALDGHGARPGHGWLFLPVAVGGEDPREPQ
jgi:heme-degrading monooxygenase HmoA